jgi:5'-3' exonuclease
MGIPVYFKTLISQYQDDILVKKKLTDVNVLCLDLNCLIHPCCRSVMETGLDDECQMIDTILYYIEQLVDYTGVSDTLYIAIDGVCPRAKMKQQRQRRHRSVFENKVWDTNSISPGTHFMRKLNIRINDWAIDIAPSIISPNIIFSGSDIPGEGEHKILEYLKKHRDTLQKKTVIYGLDADLVMLGLVSGVRELYLLRERTEYNIEDTPQPYIYLNIPELKRYIIRDMEVVSLIGEESTIMDYVFMCFLLGNDFVNHIPSLSLRYGGLEILVETYRLLQKRYMGYYRLIDTRLDTCIQLPFFKEFLREISRTEGIRNTKIQNIRVRQRARLMREYGDEYRNFSKSIKGGRVSQRDIRGFVGEDSGREKMCENLPILSDIAFEDPKDLDMSQDFLDSIVWTSIYYFRGCENWSWSTKYDHGPSLTQLHEYIREIPRLMILEKDHPLAVEDQLAYIFPQKSNCLHSYEISSPETNDLIYDLRDKRYLWECPIEIVYSDN